MSEAAAATAVGAGTVGGAEAAAAAAPARAEEAGAVEREAAAASGEQLSLRIVYAKKTLPLTLPASATVTALKTAIEKETGCPAAQMKLMYKGLLAAPNKPELDSKTLAEAQLAKNAKILVVGATAEQILEVNSVEALPKTGAFQAEAAATSAAPTKDWSSEPRHQKVLNKGKPDDALVAHLAGQDQLPDAPLSGIVDEHNHKVRLTFRGQELIISTKENTSKILVAAIQEVKSQAIKGHPEYHILALQFGPTAASTRYYYWVPANLVEGIKRFILMGGMAF